MVALAGVTLKVLLVDDSGLSRKIQAKVLREVGVEDIVEAKDGEDALGKLSDLDYQVNLVLTDWNMPGMDGMALIGALRQHPQGKSLPVIVVSSEGQEGRIAQAFSVGATSYVTKPFKKEILARKLETVRSLAEMERQEQQAAGRVMMEGDLERVGFAELVGFFNFSKRTGELIISLETGEAGISFNEGEVLDAWIGRFFSEEAFKAIAQLPKGRFCFYEGRPAKPRRIEKPTLSLLMDAMRELDETQEG